MNKSLVKLVGLTVLAASLSLAPASFAKDKDLDKADRIYKKYEEREKSKRREQSDKQDRAAAERAEARKQVRQNLREQAREQTREQAHEDQQRRSSESRSSKKVEVDSDNDVERFMRQSTDGRSEQSQRDRASSDSVARYNQRADKRRSSSSSVSSQRQESYQGDAEISLDQAVNMVRRTSNAQVLSAKSSGTKHRIKVLIDGRRVRTYVVDAISGEIY